MKIAILGAHGQLGRECQRILTGNVHALSKAAADLTKPIELRAALYAIEPAVVINCAGYTQVDRAETEPAAAFTVNALGVRALALACRDLDCTLVHVSSDYVFGMERTREVPYGEGDLPGPVNVYGASKLAGEHFVRDICAKHFILRTCGLYESGGSANFVQAMLRKGQEGQPVRVVGDQVCTPTAASDLARAVAEVVTSQAFGLYHVTNAGSCSWFEFAHAIFEIARIKTPLVRITSEEYGAAAKRPGYSVLAGTRWSGQGFTPLRSWQEALSQTISG